MSKLRPEISEIVRNLPQQGRPAPSKVARLRWPSVEYGYPARCRDLFHFPDMNLVKHRHDLGARHDDDKTSSSLELVEFTSAVEQSLKCILVLDPHFDEIGVETLAPALASSRAKDIRLLTRGGKHEREELRKTLEKFRNMNWTAPDRAEIHWSTRSLSFLHDRFAIVDNDLWHFGSTVGGGHRGLTAASGPWPEDETRGREFFEECWRRHHARPNAR